MGAVIAHLSNSPLGGSLPGLVARAPEPNALAAPPRHLVAGLSSLITLSGAPEGKDEYLRTTQSGICLAPPYPSRSSIPNISPGLVLGGKVKVPKKAQDRFHAH